MQLPNHGANPHSVYEKLGIALPNRILDFSENVNPAGPPQSVITSWPTLVDKLSVYPDPTGEPFLTAAATYHGVAQNTIFIGNGAAEILALLAQRYRERRAIIVHPTFSEYESTLDGTGATIIHIIAKESTQFALPVAEILEAMKEADVLYLCTPTNPTGILPNRADLIEIIRHGKEVHCDVVLDEAFIDFVDESYSFIPEVVENPHLIILRSMTKMYAIPGIRLGYVIANPMLINEINSVAPHWNVNGMAAHIGTLCLQEEEYRQQAILHSQTERQSMTVFLQSFGCTVTDSSANFLTFKPKDTQTAEVLYIDLIKQGIVLRHSKNFHGMDGNWLRIGMKKSADMLILKEELSQWFKAH